MHLSSLIALAALALLASATPIYRHAQAVQKRTNHYDLADGRNSANRHVIDHNTGTETLYGHNRDTGTQTKAVVNHKDGNTDVYSTDHAGTVSHEKKTTVYTDYISKQKAIHAKDPDGFDVESSRKLATSNRVYYPNSNTETHYTVIHPITDTHHAVPNEIHTLVNIDHNTGTADIHSVDHTGKMKLGREEVYYTDPLTKAKSKLKPHLASGGSGNPHHSGTGQGNPQHRR